MIFSMLFMVACVSATKKTVTVQQAELAGHSKIIEGVLVVGEQDNNHILVPRTTDLEDVYIEKPVLSYVEHHGGSTLGGKQNQ